MNAKRSLAAAIPAIAVLLLSVPSQAQTVTGSGTSGTVPKFTGTSSIGNSVISQYTDPLGNGQHIGIRTAKPLGVLGMQCTYGSEVFGSDSTNIHYHFNVNSMYAMHICPGIQESGAVQDPNGYLALGGGGLNDLVTLDQKRFTITSGVGLGLATVPDTDFVSGYRLKVNGRIRAKEVKVDASWSDFVFEPGYDLKPLDELEKAIQSEGHLPGIPTASEVEAHGVSVGEMDAKLLQKVEELTLYVIALDKKNRALEHELEQVKQQKR